MRRVRAHLVSGLLGFFLPDTPPLGKGKSWKSALGLGGFALFKNRDHAVLFCVTGLFSIPLAAFYMFSPELLKALGNKSPTAAMTIAQVTEVVAMLVLGAMMLKYRLKTILLWGLGLSALRYGLSGYAGFTGVVGWHLVGIALHGVCYTFYFVTAQVYMNRRVDPRLRGQAQGLLSLMTSGIGPLVGALLCGWLQDVCIDENGEGWETFLVDSRRSDRGLLGCVRAPLPGEKRGDLRQLAGQPDRGDHRGGVCLAFPGDGERGAVIRRGPGLRQAEGDVHRLVEVEELERDQTLIVIHRQNRIEFPLRHIAENGIRHVGAGEGGEAEFR